MSAAQTRQEISEANRRRYEELRAAGQELTPKGLPDPTPLDGAPIASDKIVSREQVPAGWYATVRLRRGELASADNREFRITVNPASRSPTLASSPSRRALGTAWG